MSADEWLPVPQAVERLAKIRNGWDAAVAEMFNLFRDEELNLKATRIVRFERPEAAPAAPYHPPEGAGDDWIQPIGQPLMPHEVALQKVVVTDAVLTHADSRLFVETYAACHAAELWRQGAIRTGPVTQYGERVSLTGLQVDWLELCEAAGVAAEPVPTGALAPAPLPKRGPGRGESYDWQVATAALLAWDNEQDVIGRVIRGELLQSYIVDWWADWFSLRINDTPSPASLKKRVKALIDARREEDAAPDRK